MTDESNEFYDPALLVKNMSMTVSFDSRIAQCAEEISSKLGISASEYITGIVEEAIEDAYDYEECAEIIADRNDSKTYTHDEIMKEFGLKRLILR